MKAVFVILCLLYVVSPIDLIPDVLPIAGWIDDLGAIGIAIKTMLSGGKKKDD